MRLPKNFGISRKSKVKSRTLSTVKKLSETELSFFCFRLLWNSYRNYRNNQKFWQMLKIYRNFWKSRVFVKNRWYKWPKFDQKWHKFDQKLLRNIRLLTKTGRLSAFQLLSKMYQNIWLLIINFPGTFSRTYLKNRNSYQNAWA